MNKINERMKNFHQSCNNIKINFNLLKLKENYYKNKLHKQEDPQKQYKANSMLLIKKILIK